MLAQSKYDASPAQRDAFIDAQLLGTLVTIGADGTPHVGYFPFIRSADGIEFHLARGDEQLDDLRARPRCTVAFHRALAFIPSHWTDPEDARHADSFHHSAILAGAAEVIDAPETVATHLRTLLARYQPEGHHQPLDGDSAFYAASYRRLAVVRVHVDHTRTKFKVGQQMEPNARANVVEQLRTRGVAL